MDSILNAAAQALARGDFLGALNQVALRDDPPALALRGIAMAQLGDLARAKALLRRAARGFGSRYAISRARCVIAETEIALVSRDLCWPADTLAVARQTLEAHGDHANAAYARHLEIRHLLLVGHLDAAERALAALDPAHFAPAFRAAHELVIAGIAMRRLQTQTAKTALARAADAARRTGIPALMAEVEKACRVMNTPAARLVSREGDQPLLLEDVEALMASGKLIIDACRFVVRHGTTVVSLANRPVLFALVQAMGEAWPGDVSRDALVARAFRHKAADESLRARLRVEIGRLRAALQPFAGINATEQGFMLIPRHAKALAVLAQPVEQKHASVLALLADGEAWSSAALALVLDTSVRTVQRALDVLAIEGRVQYLGRGRARRWISAPVPEITTTLLLPGPLSG